MSRNRSRGPINGRDLARLVRRVAEKFGQDRTAAESARIAFYLFISLFPFLLVLFSLTGMLGREAAFHWIMGELAAALPGQASSALEEVVADVTRVPSPGALSVGLLLLVWSSSNTFASLSDGLNKAYRANRPHRWWKRRALALALLGVVSLAVTVASAVLLAGPEIGRVLGLEQFESLVRWPVTFVLAVGLMWLIYYWLPNHDQRRAKRRILVGAVVGTTLWGVATVLFRLYVANFGRFSLVYGFVGGIVVLLLWLYLTAMSILIGGEVAAALERRSSKAGRT